MERNETYSQVEEWSDPASEGRRRSDAHIYSPTAHSRHPRTHPTPAPSEDKLFTDWSSIGSRSPPVVPPMHSVPIEGTPITPGMGDIHEAEQAALQPSQPSLLGSHIDTMDHADQEDLPPIQNDFQWPLERSIVPEERTMMDIGTNTSDLVIEPKVGVLRTLQMEANTQTSIPTVEVLIPPGLGDNTMIPHVSLSILGYEPDSLRTSGVRLPPGRAWEVSMIPQLDGPGSLPIRDHTGERMGRFSDQIEQDPFQGGTYVQRTSAIRRREYPGEGSGNDDYRRLHRDQRPPDKGGHPNRGGRHLDTGGHPNGGGRPPDRGGHPDGVEDP